MDFINDLVNAAENKYGADYPEDPNDTRINTGCYVFNALLSASIFGGASCSRVTALVGEPATGKSLFTLALAKNFLDANPTNGVIYFESEGALDPDEKETQDILRNLGIDMKRFKILAVETIQDFRTQAIKVLDRYIAADEETRPRMMICLDSLGNLATRKEVADATDDKDVSDMTKAKIVKGVFRILTLKSKKAKVPMIVTNHTYTQIGAMFPQQIPSGGSGLVYNASAIVALSRKKDREGDGTVVGNIIHCKNYKNRLARENKIVDVRVSYDHGIGKYYGLVELAVAAGIFKQSDKRIELPNGTKKFIKSINDSPEEYFTQEVLEKIDEYVKKTFRYGSEENDVPAEE